MNENIPSNVLHLNSNPDDKELILLPFSIKGLKWLFIGVYKGPSQNEKYFLDNLSKNLSELTCQHDKPILIGDFNLTADNKNLEIFINTFNLECLINKPVWLQFKNVSCIDLYLTNKNELP